MVLLIVGGARGRGFDIIIMGEVCTLFIMGLHVLLLSERSLYNAETSRILSVNVMSPPPLGCAVDTFRFHGECVPCPARSSRAVGEVESSCPCNPGVVRFGGPENNCVRESSLHTLGMYNYMYTHPDLVPIQFLYSK